MKAKYEIRSLQQLYDMLPEADIPCVAGCSRCCGPVPATRQELKRAPLLGNYIDQVEYFEQIGGLDASWCSTCPYVLEHGGGCAIYDGRPFMCRIYGLVEDEPMLMCPYGLRTTKPLTRAQSHQLSNRYIAIIDSNQATRAARERLKAAWDRMRER